jgi:hypothetical protein
LGLTRTRFQRKSRLKAYLLRSGLNKMARKIYHVVRPDGSTAIVPRGNGGATTPQEAAQMASGIQQVGEQKWQPLTPQQQARVRQIQRSQRLQTPEAIKRAGLGRNIYERIGRGEDVSRLIQEQKQRQRIVAETTRRMQQQRIIQQAQATRKKLERIGVMDKKDISRLEALKIAGRLYKEQVKEKEGHLPVISETLGYGIRKAGGYVGRETASSLVLGLPLKTVLDIKERKDFITSEKPRQARIQMNIKSPIKEYPTTLYTSNIFFDKAIKLKKVSERVGEKVGEVGADIGSYFVPYAGQARFYLDVGAFAEPLGRRLKEDIPIAREQESLSPFWKTTKQYVKEKPVETAILATFGTLKAYKFFKPKVIKTIGKLKPVKVQTGATTIIKELPEGKKYLGFTKGKFRAEVGKKVYTGAVTTTTGIEPSKLYDKVYLYRGESYTSIAKWNVQKLKEFAKKTGLAVDDVQRMVNRGELNPESFIIYSKPTQTKIIGKTEALMEDTVEKYFGKSITKTDEQLKASLESGQKFLETEAAKYYWGKQIQFAQKGKDVILKGDIVQKVFFKKTPDVSMTGFAGLVTQKKYPKVEKVLEQDILTGIKKTVKQQYLKDITPKPDKTRLPFLKTPTKSIWEGTGLYERTEEVGSPFMDTLIKQRVKPIQLPALILKQRARQISMMGLKTRQQIKQLEKQRLKQMARVAEKQLAKQKQKQAQLQRIAQQAIQAQKQQLKMQQRLATMQLTTPVTTQPPTITTPKPSAPSLKKVVQKIKKTQAFDVFIKSKGKEFLIGKKLPKGRALRKGVKAALAGLEATFRIEPKGLTKVKDIKFKPDPRLFRQYKIRKGRQVFTPFQFIQRKRKTGPIGSRLYTQAERRAIQRARKRTGELANWLI